MLKTYLADLDLECLVPVFSLMFSLLQDLLTSFLVPDCLMILVLDVAIGVVYFANYFEKSALDTTFGTGCLFYRFPFLDTFGSVMV